MSVGKTMRISYRHFRLWYKNCSDNYNRSLEQKIPKVIEYGKSHKQ